MELNFYYPMEDAAPTSTALFLGTADFSIACYVRFLSRSVLLQNSGPKQKLVLWAVGVAAEWAIWKLFGGVFLALVVAGVVAFWRILKSLAEERDRRRKELRKEFISTFLWGAAAWLAALAAGGMRRR